MGLSLGVVGAGRGGSCTFSVHSLPPSVQRNLCKSLCSKWSPPSPVPLPLSPHHHHSAFCLHNDAVHIVCPLAAFSPALWGSGLSPRGQFRPFVYRRFQWGDVAILQVLSPFVRRLSHGDQARSKSLLTSEKRAGLALWGDIGLFLEIKFWSQSCKHPGPRPCFQTSSAKRWSQQGMKMPRVSDWFSKERGKEVKKTFATLHRSLYMDLNVGVHMHIRLGRVLKENSRKLHLANIR